MSLVETYHAEHKARLLRMGGKPARIAPIELAPVRPHPPLPITPVDPEPYYSSMWFYNLVEFASRPLIVRIEDIQRAVCRHYRVSRLDMISGRRTKDIVFPRQIAFYIAHKITMRSTPQIGARFGGKDHTTVLHACRKVQALIDIGDADTIGQIAAIRADLST